MQRRVPGGANRTRPRAHAVLVAQGLGSGAIDLTWYLVSSVEPPLWDAVLDAYGPDEAQIECAFLHALTQAILTFSDYEPGSPPAVAWIERLEEVARRLR